VRKPPGQPYAIWRQSESTRTKGDATAARDKPEWWPNDSEFSCQAVNHANLAELQLIRASVVEFVVRKVRRQLRAALQCLAVCA
jgi:hypothetical protein